MVLYIGAHLSKDGTFLNTIKRIKEYGGNAVQIFIGSPRGGDIPEINETDAKAVRKYIKKQDIKLFSHAKYIINIAKSSGYAHHIYSKELKAINKLGGIGSVVHLGQRTTVPYDEAFKNSVHQIKKTIEKTSDIDTFLILETSVGAGSQMFSDIIDLGKLYKKFNKEEKKRIRFCIDTCHIFAAGYDIRNKKGAKEFLELWDEHIGLKKVVIIHFNDSKTKLNSKVDKHDAIGKGYITNPELGGSLKGMKVFVKYAKKYSIPLIVERNSKTTDINEIKLIKKKLIS